MDNQLIVPVIVGPTASGKTTVSVAVSLLLGGEVISADSRQIYRGLDIGTAKPTMEERRGVPHHCLDIVEPDATYSAGTFGVEGRGLIAEIAGRGRIPVVAGGSGLYLASLIDGLFDGPGADEGVRAALTARLHAGGVGELLAELRAVDPESATTIDPTKPRRIIRALEVFHLTGEPLSRRQRERRIAVAFRPLQFGLLWERRRLYARIERRCDEMLARGLLKEVESLERAGIDQRFPAMNSVGYAEALAYRHGLISFDEMVRLMKQNSRRYAKRQMTWFRRDPRIVWLAMDEDVSADSVAEQIASRVRSTREKGT